MTQDKERAKKLDKLRKLLALAHGNSNTAEALAAIGKVQALRAEYGFTEEEVNSGQFEQEGVFTSRFRYSALKNFGFCDRFLVFTLSKFCNVVPGTQRSKNDGGVMVGFFGEEANVEIAYWLRQTIIDAMDFEWSIHRDFVYKKEHGSLADAMHTFHLGMAAKLRERMKREVETQSEASTALVVRTMAIVTAKAAAENFPFLRPSRGGGNGNRVTNGVAFAMGVDAGGRVNLGRGVSHRANATAAPLAIGKR